MKIYFYKDKLINQNDLELIFYKDEPWIFNEEQFPITVFKLINCDNPNTIKFEEIDYYKDGVIIEIKKNNLYENLEIIDMGGILTTIKCNKIIQTEREYNRIELFDLIKNLQLQTENHLNELNSYHKQNEKLNSFINHNLDITSRKLTQAIWLTKDKKSFLQGQKEIFLKLLKFIEQKY
ncbi:hypothetical protein [Leptospira kanakyensis]|nr:hypothetical protein [Leptospira kanakyensis]MCW7482565.1 hypothetical protein [Leptospira kanakyensis]